MNILFLHKNFPGQYRHVAAALAKDAKNQVVFGTCRVDGEIRGVKKRTFKAARKARDTTHHYLRSTEAAILDAQAVFRMCLGLKKEGFVPDLVCAHSGWGPSLYVKEVFQRARLLTYFEWYYHSIGSDVEFLKTERITADDACRIRTRNCPILLDLVNADRGISPTYFQRSQIPTEFWPKIDVLHDGIDTSFFKPRIDQDLALPGLNLSRGSEIVTYATRGMEPYRGFPQFMRAAALLLQKRSGLHVVVAGDDRVAYGRKLGNGESYKDKMLSELKGVDLSRLHFVGSLPYGQYLRLLQASAAHIYLTVPFVLSWSLLEALACGCLVVASNTPPVREVILDGHNGLLVDFFSEKEIADRVDEALTYKERMMHLRKNARETIEARYSLATLLPKHIRAIRETAGSSK